MSHGIMATYTTGCFCRRETLVVAGKKTKKTLLTQFMRVEAADLVVPVFLQTRHSDANRTPDLGTQ